MSFLDTHIFFYIFSCLFSPSHTQTVLWIRSVLSQTLKPVICSLIFTWTKFWKEIILMLFWCNCVLYRLLWWYYLLKNENINSLQGRVHCIFRPHFRSWRLIFECAAAVLWSFESNSRLLKMKEFVLSSQQETKLSQMSQLVNITMLVLWIKQAKSNPKLPSA